MSSVSFEVLVPRVGMLLPGDSKSNTKLPSAAILWSHLAPWSNRQQQGEESCHAGVSDLDHHRRRAAVTLWGEILWAPR